MKEKTVGEFLPGEYFARYDRSVNGVKYLSIIYQIESIELTRNFKNENEIILKVSELAFGGKWIVYGAELKFPKIQSKDEYAHWRDRIDSFPFYGNKLLAEISAEEIKDLYSADLSNQFI